MTPTKQVLIVLAAFLGIMGMAAGLIPITAQVYSGSCNEVISGDCLTNSDLTVYQIADKTSRMGTLTVDDDGYFEFTPNTNTSGVCYFLVKGISSKGVLTSTAQIKLMVTGCPAVKC